MSGGSGRGWSLCANIFTVRPVFGCVRMAIHIELPQMEATTLTEPKLSKTHRWPPDLIARVEAIAKQDNRKVQHVLNELIEIGLREVLTVKRQQQRIEQVSMVIRENLIEQAHLLALDGKSPETEAHRINTETGWSYDVRWRDAEYINPTDWTRVESDRLSDTDLERAIRLAQE